MARVFSFRLTHDDQQQREGNERRHNGEPKHRASALGESKHQGRRAQGAGDCADRIERLSQSVACAANLGGRDVSDECVARCSANAFSQPIDETRDDGERRSTCEWKQRLGARRKPVAEQQQPFALSEPIAERPRKHLRDHCRRLGRAFQKAERDYAHAHRGDEKDGQ